TPFGFGNLAGSFGASASGEPVQDVVDLLPTSPALLLPPPPKHPARAAITSPAKANRSTWDTRPPLSPSGPRCTSAAAASSARCSSRPSPSRRHGRDRSGWRRELSPRRFRYRLP